jgi:gas vesicle protein
MDENMDIKRQSSNVWVYVIAGAAIGGAAGYLVGGDSGVKIRRSVTHPDELADNIEEARKFLETKSRMVTDQVRNVLQKARHGFEEGERGYNEASPRIHSRVHEFQAKTVENISRTAVTIEKGVGHPIGELGALYRGIERGIRALLGKERTTDRMAAD